MPRSVLAYGLLMLLLVSSTSEAQLSRIANKYNLPTSLMYAVQEVESGSNPYAIHLRCKARVDSLLKYHSIKYGSYILNGYVHYSVNGKTFREAEYVLAHVTPYCTKWDIGLYQISEYWVKKYKLNQVSLLDPDYNAEWGAFVLNSCFRQEKGNLWLATECYNRGSSKGRLSEYSQRVYRAHLKQLSKSGPPKPF